MKHFVFRFFEIMILPFNVTVELASAFVDCFSENQESAVLDDDFSVQLAKDNKSSVGGIRPDISKPSIEDRFEL